MNLTLSGQPFYQAELGAIYIKSMKIDSYKSPEKWSRLYGIKTLLRYDYCDLFDNQPVYVLNLKNSAEAAAFKLAKGLKLNR